MAVPKTRRVNGKRTIIRITNGNERSTSIIRLKTALNTGRGVIPNLFVMFDKTPNGKPIRRANKVESATITNVCKVEVPTKTRI